MKPQPEDGYPRVYLLPNLMTAGNLFCGFMAVLQIIAGTLQQAAFDERWQERYTLSLYFIIGAFVFDMLDGRLARLGGHDSPFGREFDSLADVVSFGLAPALLVYKIVLAEFEEFGWLIAFFYLLCGALRLARFNCLAAQDTHAAQKEFTGFPIPAAAGVIASLTLFMLSLYEAEKQIGAWRYGLPFLMVFLSFMMFSKVKYPSFKAIDWRTQWSVRKFIVAILLAFVIITHARWSFAVLFTGYLLYGFFRPMVSREIRREIEDDDDSEAGAPGAPPEA